MLYRLFLLYTALRCTKFVIESLILREFLYHRKVFSCAAVCFLIYQVKLMKLLSFADFMRQRNYGREMPPAVIMLILGFVTPLEPKLIVCAS